jgi:hypothetical protein
VLALAVAILVAAPNFLTPLAYASTQEEHPLSPETIRNEALSYAYALSSKRVDLPILIPALGAKRGAEIGSGALRADIFVLVFPAAPGKEKKAATQIIAEAAEKFFENMRARAAARAQNLDNQAGDLDKPAEVLGELYKTVYEELVKAGAIPAFLPYQNVSFLVLTVIWIKPASATPGALASIITGLGFSAVKSTADGIITVALALSGNTIDEIKEKAKEEATRIISGMISEIKRDVGKVFDAAEEQIRGKSCGCLDFSENAKICVLFNLTFGLGSELQKLQFNLSEGIADVQSKISKQAESIFVDNATKKEREVHASTLNDGTARCLAGMFSEETDYNASKIISDFGSIIRNKLNTMFHGYGSSFLDGIPTLIVGIGSSCDEAKNNLIRELNNSKDLLLKRLDDLNNSMVSGANAAIDGVFGELNEAVASIIKFAGQTIKDAISAAEPSVTKLVGEAVDTAISGAVAATSAPVFIAYALAQGFFQALQTWVKDVTITGPLDTASIDSRQPEEKMLVIEKEQQLKVRYLSEGDFITATESPPTLDQIGSAAKGFIRGFLGTLASAVGLQEAVDDIIDAVPTFVLTNIKMESSSKYLITQSKPGIYFTEIKINVHVGADMVSDFVNGLKSALFGDKKDSQNDFTNTLTEYLSTAASQQQKTTIDEKDDEKGINIIVPYLVLTPYFVTESATFSNGIATIELAAVYDFAAILRPTLNDLRNILYKGRNVLVNLESKVEKSIEDVESNIRGFIVKFAEKVLDQISERVLDAIKDNTLADIVKPFLGIVKEFINECIKKSKFYNVIISLLDKSYLFIKNLLDKAIELIDLGIDATYIADQVFAMSLTYLKIRIVNCESMGIVAFIPSLGLISQPINQEGKVTITISLESIRSLGPLSLGAVPAYQRVDPNGKACVAQAPSSVASLEPIVVPLIPVPILTNGELVIKFINPLTKEFLPPPAGKPFNVEFFADGKKIDDYWWDKAGYHVNFGSIRDSGVVTIKVEETGFEGGAVLVPVANEMPVYVNPQALAGRA